MRTLLSAQHGRPRAWSTKKLSAARATDIHPLDGRFPSLCKLFTRHQCSSPDGLDTTASDTILHLKLDEGSSRCAGAAISAVSLPAGHRPAQQLTPCRRTTEANV